MDGTCLADEQIQSIARKWMALEDEWSHLSSVQSTAYNIGATMKNRE